jgi:hypothetical protein
MIGLKNTPKNFFASCVVLQRRTHSNVLYETNPIHNVFNIFHNKYSKHHLHHFIFSKQISKSFQSCKVQTSQTFGNQNL